MRAKSYSTMLWILILKFRPGPEKLLGLSRNRPLDSNHLQCGGGQGGLNLPLPVPFNPGSRPVFFGSRPFAFIRLRNIAQCCVIFPFFSRFPLPWESRFPPPLLPPPVHLPPPFLPVSRPPVPPHYNGGVSVTEVEFTCNFACFLLKMNCP